MSSPHQDSKAVIKIRLLKAGKVIRSYKVRSSVLTIGSRKGCTLRAAGDSSMAPKHASIYVEDGALTLVPEPDAVVLLNDEKVDYAVPGPKDIIRAGRMTFRVELASHMESVVPDSTSKKNPPAAGLPVASPQMPEFREQAASKEQPRAPKPDAALAKTMLGLGAVDIPEREFPSDAEERSISQRWREGALNPFSGDGEETPAHLSWRTDSLLPGISRESKVPSPEESPQEPEISEDRETAQNLAAELYTGSDEVSDPYIQAGGLSQAPIQPVCDEAALYFSEDEEDDETAFVEPFDLAALLMAQKKGAKAGVAATPRQPYCAAHIVRVVDASVVEIGNVLPRKPFRSPNRELECRIRGRQLCLDVQTTVSGEIWHGEIRKELSQFPEKKGVRRLGLKEGDSAFFQGNHGMYKVEVYRPPSVGA